MRSYQCLTDSHTPIKSSATVPEIISLSTFASILSAKTTKNSCYTAASAHLKIKGTLNTIIMKFTNKSRTLVVSGKHSMKI